MNLHELTTDDISKFTDAEWVEFNGEFMRQFEQFGHSEEVMQVAHTFVPSILQHITYGPYGPCTVATGYPRALVVISLGDRGGFDLALCEDGLWRAVCARSEYDDVVADKFPALFAGEINALTTLALIELSPHPLSVLEESD